MSDLPKLEAALFQRELDSINKRLIPLVQGIRDLFKEYGEIRGTEAEIEEVNTWLQELPKVSSGYYAGYFLVVHTPEIRKLPVVLESAIREAAIRKHLSGAPRVTLPEPMTEEPEKGTSYFMPDAREPEDPFDYQWEGSETEKKWLVNRSCYRTAEDAITVAKAQRELLNPVKP